jgi:6-phosphofructokinase 1
MNACLRAVTRIGLNGHQTAVLGIRDGYKGLVKTHKRLTELGGIDGLKQELMNHQGRAGLIREEQRLIFLDHASVSGIVRQGGIMLGSARCLPFREKEVRARVIEMLKSLSVRSLIVCGGDGSLTGAKLITEESDLQVIGIPGTIDNDLGFTEMSLGVDTALATLVSTVEQFKDTARAHRRIMVLETMGRDSGELARRSAISSGAEIVITPEQGELTDERVMHLAESLEGSMKRGRSHAIVLISEGVKFKLPQTRNPAYVLADAFQKFFQREGSAFPDLEVRPSVLGHLQRGGNASPADSLLAARFAETAWDAVHEKKGSGVTALRGSRVEFLPFESEAAPGRAAWAQELHHLHSQLSGW